MFNIFICDLFKMIDSINNADYADDNTPFVSGNAPLNFITSLENESKPGQMSSAYQCTYTNFQ